MSDSTETSGPKRRLFMRGDCTDNTWLLCGGPDLTSAIGGLEDLLQDHVQNMMAGHVDDGEVELKIKMMTDAEVEQLQGV